MSSAVDNVADSLANTHIASGASAGANNVTGGEAINAAENEAVIASAAEGRRLYIGNLAYATTEGDLKEFFTGYSMYVDYPLDHHLLLMWPVVNPPLSLLIRVPRVPLAMLLSTSPLPKMPRRPLQSCLARRSKSVRSLSSLLESLRPPPRRPRPLLVAGRVSAVAKVVVGTRAAAVDEDAVVEAVGVAEVVL